MSKKKQDYKRKPGAFRKGRSVPPTPPNPAPPDPKHQPLTEDEFLFVNSYLIDRCGARAYRRIFPNATMSTSWTNSYEYLKRPHVREEIRLSILAQARRFQIHADDVLKGISRVAFADPYELFDEKDRPKPVREIELDTRKALNVKVARYKNKNGVDNGSVVSYEFHDKLAALRELMSHLGLHKASMGSLEVLLEVLPPQLSSALRAQILASGAKPATNGHLPVSSQGTT